MQYRQHVPSKEKKTRTNRHKNLTTVGRYTPHEKWNKTSAPEVWTEPLSGNPTYWEGSGFRRFCSQGAESYVILRGNIFVFWKYFFWKWIFCGIKGYLCTLKERFRTFVLWRCAFVLWNCTLGLWRCTFVIWRYSFIPSYFESIPFHFEGIVL